jgi:hypothetical protein
VGIRAGSRALVTAGGEAGASWTLLAAEVRQGSRKYEEYKKVYFGNGDCALLVDVWLHRVDEDASGLTFEEWDPSADTDSSEDGGVWIPAYARHGHHELGSSGLPRVYVSPQQPWKI